MKKIITLAVAIIVFCCISFGRASAQDPNAEYKKVLTEYMQVSGSNGPMEGILDQIIGMMGLTADQKAKVMASVKEKALDDLYTSMVPIYMKHVSIDDMKAAVKFYKSPEGKRLAAAVPAIATEAQQVGMVWGMKLSEMIQAEL